MANFFGSSSVDRLFNLLPLSHFTEFYNDDSTIMTKEKLFVLTNTDPNVGHSPKVWAFVSQDKNRLNISFMIEKIAGLNFPDFTSTAIQRSDNLWQNTCLECFIALTDGYLEINASPNGGYAVYYFDAYRTPTATHTDRATLSWHSDDNDNVHVYERHFSLDLEKYAKDLPVPTRLNMATVLNIKGQLHYFAINSGDTPDFHDQEYWQTWPS